MIQDERLKTHIPYIEGRRVPYWCFGEHKLSQRCKYCSRGHLLEEACKNRRFDLIKWSPIIATVCLDLSTDPRNAGGV